jgi:hypothetical protein
MEGRLVSQKTGVCRPSYAATHHSLLTSISLMEDYVILSTLCNKHKIALPSSLPPPN